MKNKVLKAMACALSVCMLSTSLVGCGNDDAGDSKTPSSGNNSNNESSSDSSDSNGGDEEEPVSIGADRSNGLFPSYDLGGVTLTVLRSNDLGNLDPDAESLQPSDDDDAAKAAEKASTKAERQDKKDYIEAKYNVKLQFVDTPTSSWDEIPAQLVLNYTSGNPTADIMDAYFQFSVELIANNVLYDFSNDMDGRYVEDNVFNWAGKLYGVSSNIAGEGLYYNKTMIKDMGMQYTPAEMFAMGQWSYDDCYAYLSELNDLMKDNLGEDAYPIFVDPTYWAIYAPAANGFALLADDGNLNYVTDYAFETFEFYNKLIVDKLDPVPAVYDDDGNLVRYDTWNYPGSTFDAGEKVAMAHRGAWQAEGINKETFKFELGFVPYPWGSNVGIDSSKIGQDDAYLTLDGYQQSCYDGQLLCLTNGIQDKADPMQVLSMVVEWMGWDSRLKAWDGESTPSCGWLEDGLDKDLYFWALARTRLETWYHLDCVSWIKAGAVFYRQEQGVRAALESAYNVDMQAMIDAGYTSADIFTPVEVEEE